MPAMRKTPPFVLGLTGSIGMGKSTVLAMFDDCGVPTFDADRAVHDLYATGGAAVAPVAERFAAASKNGAIDRQVLAGIVLGNPAAMAELEAIVHPMVRAAQTAFVDRARERGVTLVVVEIPLLFETGAQAHLDATAVVSAPQAVQRARVLARPGMTPEKLDAILSQQMPDAEKRRRADYIIDTAQPLAATRKDVENLIAELASRPGKR